MSSEKYKNFLRVLADAALVIIVWLAVVRPWTQGAVSPVVVAIISALAGLVLMRRRTLLRAQHGKAMEDQLGLLKDLALAFAIMALVAIAFAGLNLYLQSTDSAAARDATLAQVAAMQSAAAGLTGWTKSFQLASKIGATVLALGFIMLVLRAGGLFDMLFKARKGLSRGLRVAALLALCLGSFSLGGSVGAQVLDGHARRAYALNAGAAQSLGRLQRAIEREVAQAVAEALLQADRPECHADAEICDADPLQVMHDELERASAWRESWPERPALLGLPAEPSSTREFTRAASVDAAVAAPEPSRPAGDIIAPALRDQPLNAAQLAAQQLGELPATPERARLRELVGLALSLSLETSGLAVSPNMDAALGGFVTKISSSITDAVRSQLQNLIRDTAVEIVAACKAGPRACLEEGRRRLNGVRSNPRMRALTARLAAAGRAPTRHYRQLADSLWLVNRNARTQIEGAVGRVEAGEGRGEWGVLRRRWTADLRAGRVEDLTTAQREGWLAFVSDWEDRRGELAREMVREGRTGSPSEWDRVFLDYTRGDANSAAIFGYMIVNDLQIRPFLMARQPAVINRMIDVADAYLLFTATVERRSWAPDSMSPDQSFVAGYGFRNAVGRYCPNHG